MGCDIHTIIEVKVPVGPLHGKGETEWRRLQREVALDPGLAEEFRSRSVLEWTLGRKSVNYHPTIYNGHYEDYKECVEEARQAGHPWASQMEEEFNAVCTLSKDHLYPLSLPSEDGNPCWFWLYSLLSVTPGKDSRDSEWNDDRSYDLFAKLTGTVRARNGVDRSIVSQPRGLPDDSTKWGRYLDEDVDHHSTSWLTMREILEWPAEEWDKPAVQYGGDSGYTPTRFLALCRRWGEVYGLDTCRLVFAFDN